MSAVIEIDKGSRLGTKYQISELGMSHTRTAWGRRDPSSYYSHEQTTAKALSTLCRGLEFIFEHEYGGWSWSSELQRGINCGFGYSVPTNPKFAYPNTIEGVRVAVEKMIADAQREQQDDYDFDPASYMEYSRTNPHEVHPWGDTVDVLRAWLNADPFEWFCVHQELNSWAKYLVEDSLFDIIGDSSEGASLSENLKDKFETLMKAFIKDYEQSQ